MKTIRIATACAFLALVFTPVLAQANSGDFDGGVAIGSGYASTVTAPTNGAIVQGNVGIGTSSPQASLHVNGGVITGNDTASCASTNAGEIIWNGSNLQYCDGSAWQTLGGGVPSGTWCGMGDNIYGTNIDCMGYYPQTGCPTGYSQGYFAQYGGGALFVCVKN